MVRVEVRGFWMQCGLEACIGRVEARAPAEGLALATVRFILFFPWAGEAGCVTLIKPVDNLLAFRKPHKKQLIPWATNLQNPSIKRLRKSRQKQILRIRKSNRLR